MTSDLRPRWLRQVNDAMDVPLTEGREVLAQVLTERRERAAELRALAARSDVTDERRRVYLGMAEWADDSIRLVEQATARLADLETAGHVATGREQIDRETEHACSRGWSR